MKKQVSSKMISITFGVLVICFAVGFYAYAVWQEPTDTPPGGNVSAPINVGAVEQIKSGRLGLSVGDADNTYGLTVGNTYGNGLKVTGSSYFEGNIVLLNNSMVDGVDISDYSPYFINSAGSNSQVWTSDGSGIGYWGTAPAGGELQNLFSMINVSDGTKPVADNPQDTLHLFAGSGITITGNSASDVITIASTIVDTWITTQTCPSGKYLSSVGKDSRVCSTPSGGIGGDSDWNLIGGGAPTLSGNIYHLGKIGVGAVSLDTHYGITTTGGGIKAESTTQPAGYFNSTSSYGLLVNNGNVGIGDIEPDAKLDVLNTGTGTSFRVDDSSDGDTTPFVIDANGNVGIGTASPLTKLHVVGDARITGLTNCNTIDTDADGNLECGTDEAPFNTCTWKDMRTSTRKADNLSNCSAGNMAAYIFYGNMTVGSIPGLCRYTTTQGYGKVVYGFLETRGAENPAYDPSYRVLVCQNDWYTATVSSSGGCGVRDTGIAQYLVCE